MTRRYDNARGAFAPTPLTDKNTAVAEELHPRAIFTPFSRMPGVLASTEHAFRMRHHDECATVFGAEAVDAKRRAVRVERVAFGVFVLAIDITECYETRLEAGFGSFAASEFGTTFAVSNSDREHRTSHSLEEYSRSIFDLQRAEAGFEAFGDVLHKARPVLGTRNQILEVRDHLAAVADAEREGILAVHLA